MNTSDEATRRPEPEGTEPAEPSTEMPEDADVAGAGGGGTIIALTHDPETVIAKLKKADASRILYPVPSPGVTVKALDSSEDWDHAEEELRARLHPEDFKG